MFELCYTDSEKFRVIGKKGEEIKKSKKIVEDIVKLLAPEHMLVKIQVNGDNAVVAYKETDLNMKLGFDYGERTFFQEKGKRGYYSSYGFGTTLRELEKGKLEDYFTGTPKETDTPQNKIEAGCYQILKENGIKLNAISFRQYIPSEFD